MSRYRAPYKREFGKHTDHIEYMTIKYCYYCGVSPSRYFHIWNRIGRYVIAGCDNCADRFQSEMTAYQFEEVTYEDILTYQVLSG